MVHSKSSLNAIKRIFKRLLIFLTSTTFVLWQGSSFLLSRPDDLRRLSINYGGGRCKWQPPKFNVPSDIDWLKTLVVGFPSGDKRLAFMQMEGLTGWPARDEWAYETFGMSNHPFIKSNYPHYDGVWGWEDAADQVLLIVRNVRRTLTEFHHIMWDLKFVNNYIEALASEDNLFRTLPPRDHFLSWRDERVLGEIHWYGWFIDYWMEGGMMRDVHTHNITIPDHWFMFYSPDHFQKKHRSYASVVGDGPVTLPSYDQRCLTKVANGCKPVAVVSAERLVERSTGPSEAAKIAKVLEGKRGISDFLIAEEAWPCIWEELIINKKGAKTFLDREGVDEREYNFSEEMLDEMIHEVDRLIQKYGSSELESEDTAQDLAEALLEHKVALEKELKEVQDGVRVLREDDFLGPKTRQKLRLEKLEKLDEVRDLKVDNYSRYFQKLEGKLHDHRNLFKIEKAALEERRLKRKL